MRVLWTLLLLAACGDEVDRMTAPQLRASIAREERLRWKLASKELIIQNLELQLSYSRSLIELQDRQIKGLKEGLKYCEPLKELEHD